MADSRDRPTEAELTASHELTRLLGLWSSGQPEALDELLPLVYDELRALAGDFMRRERSSHTLQPTALVHEAYLRLTGHSRATVRGRAHFFAVAAQAMRRILVDYARRQRSGKRIQEADKAPLDEAPSPVVEPDIDVLELNEALSDLYQANPRQAQIVELRYFGGLTIDEAAQIADVSPATVEREWHAARLWLRHHMTRSPELGS